MGYRVAADRYGPFARVDVTVDGAPAPLERWGDYFFRISLPYPARTLVITATSVTGETRTAELSREPD